MPYLDMLKEIERTPVEPWSADQEQSAREIHDQALLRLARECPPGSLTWARQTRPDLMAAVESAYTKMQEAFLVQDFVEALAAIRTFEEANITLFREFTTNRKLGDMPIEEAEKHLVEIFSARRVNPVPERKTGATPQQTSLTEAV